MEHNKTVGNKGRVFNLSNILSFKYEREGNEIEGWVLYGALPIV